MKERTRNAIVGLTVFVALILLGCLVLLFAGLPEMFQTGYEIRMRFDHTGATEEGDAVYMSGVEIGRITDIRFAEQGKPYAGIIFTARVDPDIRIPGNARANMYTRGISGQPYIELKPEGEPIQDPVTGEPYELLPTDRVVTLQGKHHAGNVAQETRDLAMGFDAFLQDARPMLQSAGPAFEAMGKLGELADEAGPALRGMTRLMENLNRMFEPVEPPDGHAATRPADGEPGQRPDGRPATRPAETPMAKLSRILDGMDRIFGDPENQEHLAAALANFDKAGADAVEALESLRQFADDGRAMMNDLRGDFGTVSTDARELIHKLIAGAEQISKLTESLHRTAVKIERGEGTAGRMVTDAELYENLLTATERLSETLDSFNQLIEKWEREGVDLKLK